jgi:transglutaminase-like putative cysteine protease
MQIAIVIAICIAFSCSSTIYAVNIDEPVINNSTSPQTIATESASGDNNSTDIIEIRSIVENQNYTKDNSSEHEEAGVVDNHTQDPILINSSYNNSAQNEIQAAGTTISKYSATFDLKSIKNAASRVKTFIETNQKLPSYVVISDYKLTMSEFLYLLLKGTSQLNSGITTNMTLKSVSAAISPSGNAKTGVLSKTEYVNLANKVLKYMETNGRAPNYASSSLGKIQYQKLIYIMSKIVNFQATKGYMPKTVSVTNIIIKTNSSTSDGIGVSAVNEAYNGETLANYLKSTANCQVTDTYIKSLSKAITSGLSSNWSKASAIFKWVRDNLNYSFYYNTKNGAVKTLELKSGNCVDHSHLIIALARASGIPARYVHGSCVFNSGTTYGHVWAQLYVNGVWYAADAISYSNILGEINNWDTSNVTIKGKYAELPF